VPRRTAFAFGVSRGGRDAANRRSAARFPVGDGAVRLAGPVVPVRTRVRPRPRRAAREDGARAPRRGLVRPQRRRVARVRRRVPAPPGAALRGTRRRQGPAPVRVPRLVLRRRRRVQVHPPGSSPRAPGARRQHQKVHAAFILLLLRCRKLKSKTFWQFGAAGAQEQQGVRGLVPVRCAERDPVVLPEVGAGVQGRAAEEAAAVHPRDRRPGVRVLVGDQGSFLRVKPPSSLNPVIIGFGSSINVAAFEHKGLHCLIAGMKSW
jgi:hypothetical protein